MRNTPEHVGRENFQLSDIRDVDCSQSGVFWASCYKVAHTKSKFLLFFCCCGYICHKAPFVVFALLVRQILHSENAAHCDCTCVLLCAYLCLNV